MNDYRFYSSELYHHGILGQKWGVRRYQNPDGTLTAEGRSRLKSRLSSAAKSAGESIAKVYNKQAEKARVKREAVKAKKAEEKADLERRKAEAAKRARLLKMAKKHPELLTNQELYDLNNRAQSEQNFKKNYNLEKKGKEVVQKQKEKGLLLNEVIKPSIVALGKAAVMAEVGGGDFKKIASVQLDRAYSNQKNNNQKKGKVVKKEDKGLFKKKKGHL